MAKNFLPTSLFFPLGERNRSDQIPYRIFWGLSLSVAIIGGALLGAAAIFSVLAGGNANLNDFFSAFAEFFFKNNSSFTVAGGVTLGVAATAAAPAVIAPVSALSVYAGKRAFVGCMTISYLTAISD